MRYYKVPFIFLAIFIGCTTVGTVGEIKPVESVAAEKSTTSEAPQKAVPQAKTPAAKSQSDKDVTAASPIKVDPKDPMNVIYLDSAGKSAGLGDPTKPASEFIKIGRGYHPQALSAAGLPKDKYGLVDWAKIVKDKLVIPKHSLDPSEAETPPNDMDILIQTKSDFVNNVVFPHWIHTYWLSCQVCHPNIFVPAKGQNNMTMAGIAEGKWCGRCHGKIAFPLADCTRCHVSAKDAKKVTP